MKRFFALLLCLCMLAPAASYAASTYALMQQCAAYAENDEYEKALACFELAQMADPDMTYDPLLMGYVWLNTGNPESARLCADMAVSASPMNPDTWRLVQTVALFDGNQSAAEKAGLYITLLSYEEAPYMTAADWLLTCKYYAEEADYTAALACFELAQTLDPTLAYDPYMMATVFLINGYPAEARNCAEAVVAAAPHSVEAWLLYHSVYSTLGIDQEAEKALLYLSILSENELLASSVDTAVAGFFTQNSPIAVQQELFFENTEDIPYSVSPDGLLGLFLTPDSILLVPRDNPDAAVTVVPSTTRGVEDTYSKLERIFARPITTLDSSVPAIWSPDSRYVTFGPWETALQQVRMYVDPFVIDTKTGEWIILEAFDKTSPIKGGGTMFQACFSQDSSRLYYAVIGGPEEYRYSIRCADLATGETSVLFGTDTDFEPAYPSLCLTENGGLINLEYAIALSQPHGINLFRPSEYRDEWTRIRFHFNLPGKYWRPTQLEYSADSGYGLVLGNMDVNITSFKRFTLETGLPTGADTQYVITGETQPEITAMTAEEYIAYCDANASNPAQTSAAMQNLWHITAIRLSPDGEYALIAGGRTIQEPFLLCVRLSDMQVLPVSVPDGFSGTTLCTALTYGAFRPGLLWCETGEIITVSDNQRVMFTIGEQ